MSEKAITRRTLLTGAAAAAGGALLSNLPASAQQAAPADPTKAPGAPTSAVGTRSPFVTPRRAPVGEITGTSLTPLQALSGVITPADLHFTRIHAGVPAIDPAKHTLLIHGLVDRPLELTLADLERFPAVTHDYFVECAGNGRDAYRTPKPDMTPQQVDGMLGNSEWTGVPLTTLFREVGVKSNADWFLAEGGDACLMARSIPVRKAREDAIIAYAQNGEPLRPEQGFPMRLLLPGWEGNTNVKWLRRIKLATEPFMTRWETSKYTDPLPGGTVRQFSFEMDAKSLITSPAYPERLSGPGWWAIRGLAWSGRGRVTRVDVSTDGGKHWIEAELLTPTSAKTLVRFQHMWQWTGDESLLMSRAVDDTGYVQPTLAQLRAARGPGTDYHFNSIRAWRVARDGAVTFEANT
ncbi:MAG: sulfite dehydrogenase [Gemmatimonadaceae bacterium]